MAERDARCRYCGEYSLYTPKKPRVEIVVDLVDAVAKMCNYMGPLTPRSSKWREFARRYNQYGKRGDHRRLRANAAKMKRWGLGLQSVPREAAIRIALVVKSDGNKVWECPIFHPHAAMRAYAWDYHQYYTANREWFHRNPGKDPGAWWIRSDTERNTHE